MNKMYTFDAQHASTMNEESAQKDANTARAGFSKVRTLPAVTNPQTGPITIHCAAASQRPEAYPHIRSTYQCALTTLARVFADFWISAVN